MLLPSFLSAQSIASSASAANIDLAADIDLEASFGTMPASNSMSVYPRIIKKAQVFVLYFDYEIKEAYTVNLVSASGELIETIYNSQLSVFNAKSTLSLEVQTPLEAGMYYVVLSSNDFNQATKLMKF